ncbi:MAG: circularly permuted type 2 ATP-grasp protein [Myxococcales bacterium]|nr:circularly permuted type 2 ATP-grasp protein [Myxococcales bacterium]
MQSPWFTSYRPLTGAYDEYVCDGALRDVATAVVSAMAPFDAERMRRRQELADAACVQGGVTFSVYSDARGEEKIFPFDLVPRVLTPSEWDKLHRGIRQRVVALNRFIDDLYTERRVLRDRVIPADVVDRCSGWVPQVAGVVPRGRVWVHIAGIDLVRDAHGEFLVLEDNLRCPSGVSYVLENRALMKRAAPNAFEALSIASVEAYPIRLQAAMEALSPLGAERPVILTPGRYNSAYFEHGFLARRAGAELVEGSDLIVEDDRVYLKTTAGLQLVDVIYRRIDDAFLDPRAFRPDSLLGVPGLFGAYAAGNVTLMNAIGNGVADDKAVYPYVPDLIRYYLGEDAILGQVPTFRCAEAPALDHVLKNLESLVVKQVDGAGGYGMLFGPRSTAQEREAFAAQLRATPERYIAQPVVELSACPVVDGDRLRPCRVDLRPYVITSDPDDPWVLPGGLTRVALEEGSYVVNSSQGGGSKDTWVLTEEP